MVPPTPPAAATGPAGTPPDKRPHNDAAAPPLPAPRRKGRHTGAPGGGFPVVLGARQGR